MGESTELKELSKLAEKQLKLEKDIVKYEEALKIAKTELIFISEEVFPDKMAEFELYDITIKGNKIELLDDFRCNFPSMGGIEKASGEQKTKLIKRKRDGVKWMKKNNHEGLMKYKVVFEFGMGEYKILDKFKTKTQKAFPALEFSDSETIHPATLKKFLKELGEDGIDYPKEVFGVSPYKRVVITEQ